MTCPVDAVLKLSCKVVDSAGVAPRQSSIYGFDTWFDIGAQPGTNLQHYVVRAGCLVHNIILEISK